MTPFFVDHLAGEARTMRRIEDGQSTFHWEQPLKKKKTSIYFQGIVSFYLWQLKALSKFQPKHATNQELKYRNSPFPVHHGQILFTLVINPSPISIKTKQFSQKTLLSTESKPIGRQPNSSRDNSIYLARQLVLYAARTCILFKITDNF